MFDLINGLPVHPLVVHAVVVLLPLAIVGTLAIAARPRWRTRYGTLVVAIAAVGTGLIPVATSSGEALERRVGDPGRHAHLGDQLIWFALPLLVLVSALVLAHHQNRRSRSREDLGSVVEPRSTSTVRVIAALAVVAALVAGVQVYRVGDSGARAAWGNRVTARG